MNTEQEQHHRGKAPNVVKYKTKRNNMPVR